MSGTVNDCFEKSRLLIQSGRFEEALQCVKLLLKERPDQGLFWHEAGVLLVRLGRPDEAVSYFLRCFDLPNPPPQAYHSLSHCYLSIDQPGPAWFWLKKGLRQNYIDETAVIQAAESFDRHGDAASAMDVLQEGRQKLGVIGVLERQIETLKTKRAKIAFFCGADGAAFLRDIVHYAKQRYPVRFFEGRTQQDVFELMQWSDISWFEWSTELARIGSTLPKVCRSIVRLHRYEAHLNWPKLINWQNIDVLMTVGNEWVIKAINHWVGDISRQTCVVTIPNGVDVDSIAYKPRRPGKKIAFVAKLRMVKNPMLLAQCMAELLKIDPGYKLYMAGERHDLLLRHYLEHITEQLGIADAFVYDEWQDNIPAWLDDKNFIVSTSVIESQGMGLLEAMAAGIKPVIHHFPGAEGIFGDRYLFRTPQEFCRQILGDAYRSEEYREFVERRYPLQQQLLRVNELFAGFEAQPFEYPQAGRQHDGFLSRQDALAAVV